MVYGVRDLFVKSQDEGKRLIVNPERRLSCLREFCPLSSRPIPNVFLRVNPTSPSSSNATVPWRKPSENFATGHQTPETKTGQTQGAKTRPASRRGAADSIYDKRRTVKKSLGVCVFRPCVESCQIRCCVQGDRASGSRYEQSLNLQEIVTASTVQMLTR